jgi:Zinc dependent phospholipase C
MKMRLYKFCWLLPIILHAADANAWGLMTHLYFAHSLLWAMPALDARLRKAVQNFPDLVMAGACLPDLAIVSKHFKDTHDWQHAHHLIDKAETDEELAIAIGYASHLYVDVIAHNHFVPAHEEMWTDNGMLAHIASEWAMDAHLQPLLHTSPSRLINKHKRLLTTFISENYPCSFNETKKALTRLSFWDGVLRTVKIPHIIYLSVRIVDKRVFKHFVYYISKTQTAISEIGIVLSGERPAWKAELLHLNDVQLSAWRLACLGDLALLHPAPISYFLPNN